MIKYKLALHLLAFFVLTIFVITPGTLYLFNYNEWNQDYWLVGFFLILGAISFLGLLAIYYLFNIFSNQLSSIFAYLFFTLGMVILLNDILSPVQLGVLDGRQVYSNEPILFTVLESVIFFITIFIIWFRIRKKESTLLLIVKPLYAVSFGIIILVFIVSGGQNQNDYRKIRNNNQKVERLPNIYHFHIDGMQTDYFLRYIKDYPEVTKVLGGFTLYEKNISNYPTTMLSLASYLTSTTHLNGRFDKWVKNYDEGLLKQLKQNGYKLIHSSNAPHRSKYFDNIISIPELLKRYKGAEHLSVVQFTRIWLAKLVPNFFTNESLSIGKNLGKFFFYKINPNHNTDISLTIEDGTAALSGILMLEDIISDMPYYTQDNQYVFLLNSILHDSYVTSPDCKVEKRPDYGISRRYYRQLQCTMNLIEQFIVKLKAINKYDDSVILIHADHGSHWVGQLLNTQGKSFKTNMDNSANLPYDSSIGLTSLVALESKARALLMIKPINTKGDLKISNQPTELLDIYPTIMGLLGIDYLKNTEGRNIFDSRDLENRSRYFYYMAPSSYQTQVKKYHVMIPEYDNFGILSLSSKNKGQTTFQSFFKNAKKVKKYKDINFYYKNVDGKIITNLDWVFIDGMDTINNWGAWTNSNKVTLGFIPKDNKYKRLILKIKDVSINSGNNTLNADIYLNKSLIGSISFKHPKSDYLFPNNIEFPIPDDIILENKPNIFEIHIEGYRLEKNFGTSRDPKELALALVQLSLE
jgi:hypothetical protein